MLEISSVTKPSHSGSNGVTFVMIPHRAYVDLPTVTVRMLRGMRKYSTERASAKLFGGTMQTSPSHSTKQLLVEVLRVDDRVQHVGEDLELARHAHVVAVGAHPVGDDPFADLASLEGLDHPVLLGHSGDPAVGHDRHMRVCSFEWWRP